MSNTHQTENKPDKPTIQKEYALMKPSPALQVILGQLKYLKIDEILWLIQQLAQQISHFVQPDKKDMQLRHAERDGDIPTMAELLERLDKINAEDPIEFEPPERINRPTPFDEVSEDVLV